MSLVDEINQLSNGQVKAVAFDIGGVLIRINHTWQDAMRDAGISGSAAGPLGGFPAFDEFQLGKVDLDVYLEGLREFLGVKTPEEALIIHNHILRGAYEGTEELVEELNERGILTGCLSNTNQPHWIIMNSGLYPNIEALKKAALSHEMKLQKPDPAIFQAFEDCTGCRPPEIVFFDDLEDNVEAAREKGWKAFWIDHDQNTAEQMELILIHERVLPPP